MQLEEGTGPASWMLGSGAVTKRDSQLHMSWESSCQVLLAESCLGASVTAALQPPPGLGNSSEMLGDLCPTAPAARGTQGGGCPLLPPRF